MDIRVTAKDEENLNGLGQMMLQYLSQNIKEFEKKAKQAAKLQGTVSVEVGNNIATSLVFLGGEIQIHNGIAAEPDLHMKGSYLVLAKILSGSTGPLKELLAGGIKLKAWPRKPIESLRILSFLKTPPDFSAQTPD